MKAPRLYTKTILQEQTKVHSVPIQLSRTPKASSFDNAVAELSAAPLKNYNPSVDASSRPQMDLDAIQTQQQRLKKPILRQKSLQQESPSDLDHQPASFKGRRASDTDFLKNTRQAIVGEFERCVLLLKLKWNCCNLHFQHKQWPELKTIEILRSKEDSESISKHEIARSNSHSWSRHEFPWRDARGNKRVARVQRRTRTLHATQERKAKTFESIIYR